MVTHPGNPSSVLCPALVGPAEGQQAQDRAGPAVGLAGDAGAEEEGGEGGADERPPPALDEPAAQGGLQPAVLLSGK